MIPTGIKLAKGKIHSSEFQSNLKPFLLIEIYYLNKLNSKPHKTLFVDD